MASEFLGQIKVFCKDSEQNVALIYKNKVPQRSFKKIKQLKKKWKRKSLGIFNINSC